MPEKEIYFSTDIETDGPIPGEFSMLSFASACFTADGKLIDTFEVNLEVLPDAKSDPSTMEWWKTQPDAWKEHRKNLREPIFAMQNYSLWVKSVAGLQNAKPICVCYPAGFDFTFLYWYLVKFAGKSPYGFSCLDIKSYGMSLLGSNFQDSTKKQYPQEWFKPDLAHTHKALDDALEQGHLFMSMLKHRKEHDLF